MIEPGTRFGPYEVTAALGVGGMGEVYRARDTRLERDVAIKVLPPGLQEDEERRLRFEREARTVSQLNHPHICTLYDVGREGEQHYLVMELLEGESLAERLQKRPLPQHLVLRYGAQVAEALHAAHKQGITHRDLKPANVMITKSGAKLLDFGLAKAAAEGASPIEGLSHGPTEARPLTEKGSILGTFQYMAPEQLEGLEADARTDIFALGSAWRRTRTTDGSRPTTSRASCAGWASPTRRARERRFLSAAASGDQRCGSWRPFSSVSSRAQRGGSWWGAVRPGRAPGFRPSALSSSRAISCQAGDRLSPRTGGAWPMFARAPFGSVT